MGSRCTERSRIDVRSSVKILADPAPAHDHAAKASLFEVPYRMIFDNWEASERHYPSGPDSYWENS